MLAFNCLIAEEGATAAKRQLIINSEFMEPTYCNNVLTSKFKSKYILLWGKEFAFIYIGHDRLWFIADQRNPGLIEEELQS